MYLSCLGESCHCHSCNDVYMQLALVDGHKKVAVPVILDMDNWCVDVVT